MAKKDKEFEVTAERYGKPTTLPIKAVDAATARLLAERILKRRGGKASKVIAVTEAKKP
jgi:hypothetical protein